MYRLFCVAFLAILTASTTVLHAQQKPDPSLSAEAVVALQLDGLKRNDVEGMQLVWDFAHPDNKRSTGPLERFAAMLTQPDYKILLGHRTAEIQLVLQQDDIAIFEVAVIYRWGLRKVDEGEQKGSWMTIMVSPPLGTGNEI